MGNSHSGGGQEGAADMTIKNVEIHTATLPPTETPTATIQPTETETPVAVIETSEEEQVIENKTNTENRILHTPKADLKTYLIMGAILAILTGGGIIIISQFMKKK